MVQCIGSGHDRRLFIRRDAVRDSFSEDEAIVCNCCGYAARIAHQSVANVVPMAERFVTRAAADFSLVPGLLRWCIDRFGFSLQWVCSLRRTGASHDLACVAARHSHFAKYTLISELCMRGERPLRRGDSSQGL